MAKKGSLFYLIKSLNKSEKRYFKLSVAGNGAHTNYLRLFDFIDKQEVLDERAIKRNFKGETFTNQLHVAKNYLYNLILKTLRNYKPDLSVGATLRNLLMDVEILYKRELYDQCHYRLKKAMNLAQKHEKLEMLMEILAWERTLIQHKSGANMVGGSVLETISKERRVLLKLNTYNRYLSLAYNMFNQDFRDPKVASKIFEDDLLTSQGIADSLQSKTLYYHIKYALWSMTGEPQKGIKAISSLISLLESKPHRIKDNPNTYITALSNKMGALLHTKQLDEIPNLLEKIRSFPAEYGLRQDNFMLRMMLKTYNVELELYRDTIQLTKGVRLISEIEQFLEKNKASINESHFISFYYQFAYIWFLKKEYSNALGALNTIVNQNFGAVREDIQSYSRMLYLIIHFELNNIMVLKYAIDSCRRFLKKKRTLHHYEKELLRFFSKICVSPVSEYTQLFMLLDNQLFSKTEEPQRRNILDYLDFQAWIRSKLDGD